jgi:hypothetical protein
LQPNRPWSRHHHFQKAIAVIDDDDLFTPKQLAAMAADLPVLMTAAELGRLFGLSADEIRGLAAEGLVVSTGNRFDAKLSSRRYFAYLRRVGLQ